MCYLTKAQLTMQRIEMNILSYKSFKVIHSPGNRILVNRQEPNYRIARSSVLLVHEMLYHVTCLYVLLYY